MSAGVEKKKLGRPPGSKTTVKRIKASALTLDKVNKLHSRMYSNRTYFMDLYDKYGKYDYDKFERLIERIESGKTKVSVYELSVIRILQDISDKRISDMDKIAGIFSNVLQFMAGDYTKGFDYKTAPDDILSSYQAFCKKNKKTAKDFAVDFDNWVMFMCSDPGLWSDEAFRVIKTIGDWILKINLHHANAIKVEKFDHLMNRLKEILKDRVGTQHPETYAAVLMDLGSLMHNMDLLGDLPEVKAIKQLPKS